MGVGAEETQSQKNLEFLLAGKKFLGGVQHNRGCGGGGQGNLANIRIKEDFFYLDGFPKAIYLNSQLC